MANFELSYENMLKLEFNSPANALHYNRGEKGYTFMGIYEAAHPKWAGWEKIHANLKMYGDIKATSQQCYKDQKLQGLVEEFYKEKFWDAMKLDQVIPYKTADLMFKFGVNVGINRAVRYAQQVVKVNDDGIVGAKTLKALNSYIPLNFEGEYKAKFNSYYIDLAKSKRYASFLNGWLNRVRLS